MIAFSLAMDYPKLVDWVVSIEGAVVKPEKLPGGEMAMIFKYPINGDFFIWITRLGLMNRLAMHLIAGEWYPNMTEQEKREMLEQLTENSRSATRAAWYLIDAAVQNSRDLEEEAKGITVPVLYLYGNASHDFMLMIQANLPFFERYMPIVKVVAVPDAIHDMAFQKPDEVAALVGAFFEEGKAITIN